MKENELKQALATDAGLDAALARMADDVPPVPAGFHDRWMNAVRAEAEKTAPEAEKTRKRTASLVRWTGILSAAAVFVFLIGGTLLYRNAGKTLPVQFAAEKRETVETAAGEDGAAPVFAAEPEIIEEAAEAYASEEEAPEEPAPAAGESADGVYAAKNADSLWTMHMEAPANGDLSRAAGAAMEEADAWEADMEEEAEYGEEAAVYEAAEESRADVPEMTAAPTAEPTVTPAVSPTPEVTAEPVPAEAPEAEKTGFLQETGAFFTDMGSFLRSFWPYLLVLLVPGAAVLAAVRRKKGR